MILVLDSRNVVRNELAAAVSWIDGRHRVVSAENTYDASRIARRERPTMILVGPNMPQSAVRELRASCPQACIVAVSNSLESAAAEGDACFQYPLKHEQLRDLITRTRKNISRRARDTRNREGQAEQKTIHVMVRIAEHADSLKFKVTVREGSTIGDVLQQLGKQNTVSFTHFRKGDELTSNASTPVQDGDELTLVLERT